MKSKEQKRKEAAERIFKEISHIESLPEDQQNSYRLNKLKLEYNSLKIFNKNKKVPDIEKVSVKKLFGYTIEQYLDDMEAYKDS